MPRGDWCLVLAALGCLTLTGVAEGKNQQGQKRQQAGQAQGGPSAPAVLKPKHRPDDRNDTKEQCVNAAGAKQDCNAAAAQATIDQAGYAFWQTVAGVIGTFAGVGTLVAAVWAGTWAKKAALHTETGAKQAGAAVAAAREATEFARASFLSQDRPHLFVEVRDHTFHDWRSGDMPFSWQFIITNYGKSPALFDSVDYDVFLAQSLPETNAAQFPGVEEFAEWPEMRSGYGFGRQMVISAGAIIGPLTAQHGILMKRDATIPADVIERRGRLYLLTAGPLGFFLHGKVKYRDVHGQPHETGFCFRCEPPFGHMHEAGDEKRNYRT